MTPGAWADEQIFSAMLDSFVNPDFPDLKFLG